MKQLLKYLKDYKLESVLGPLFKMLEASFELFVPLVMAQIIDVGIKDRDASYILKMGGVLLLLAVIGLTCSLTAQYFAAKAAVGFSTALRNDLFAHINRLSYSEQDTIGTSTLITRMTSDVNQVQSGLNLTLRLLLRSPFIVFGAMIMAFTVNAKAAMVFVVAIPALSVVVFGIMAASMPLYKKVQRQLDKVTQATRENLTGVRVIRAFNRQQDEMDRFRESNDQLVRFQVFVGKISALMNPVTYVIINLAFVAVIWISGKQVDFEDIYCEGITKITVEDMKYAKAMGMTIKLLATCKRDGEKLNAMVAPCLLRAEHPLFAINGVFNSIFVHGNMLGDAMFYGSGAGKLPTASAVVGDIVEEARNLERNLGVMWSSEKLALEDRRDVERRFFVRMKGSREELQDRVASVFGMVQFVRAEGVSGEFGFVTERMPEGSYEEKAGQFDGQILGMIRVEE